MARHHDKVNRPPHDGGLMGSTPDSANQCGEPTQNPILNSIWLHCIYGKHYDRDRDYDKDGSPIHEEGGFGCGSGSFLRHGGSVVRWRPFDKPRRSSGQARNGGLCNDGGITEATGRDRSNRTDGANGWRRGGRDGSRLHRAAGEKFWKSYSDSGMMRGVIIDTKRKGETRAQIQGCTATERRDYKEESVARVKLSAIDKAILRLAVGGKSGAIYVSPKRTHRFFGQFFVYLQRFQELMPFAAGVCRWVRFGK